MALIIEDGTIVPDANSFITVAECRAYLTARGLSVSTNDTTVEQLLVQASDFLLSIENQFKGYRKVSTQDLPFPRENLVLFATDISGTIPKILKNAQARLAYDAEQADLMPTGAGRVVLEEKVGPLATKYANDGVANPSLDLKAAFGILEPLLNESATLGGGSINIPVDR